MSEQQETEEQRKVRLSLRLTELLVEEGLQLKPYLGWAYMVSDDLGKPWGVVLFDDYDRPLHGQVSTTIPWERVVKLVDKGPRRLP